MPERESDDPDFSAPPVPTPPPSDPGASPEKPKKQPKPRKPKAESEPDDESDADEKPTPVEPSKPKAGERGHPQVGDAEPVPPTPAIGAEEQSDIIAAQRAKKHGIRLKKALKEFPEIQDILDENEALKAKLAELTK